jgi:tetratricopeptide (TPR) repeat protein
MDKKWHDLENLLRRGERSAVLRGVRDLTRSPLNQNDRLQAARLYRKAGLPGRSLRILGNWDAGFSDLERAEYGAALVNLGAVHEGMRILDCLSSAQDPRVTWIRAAQRIRQWDWSAAIPLLESLPQSEMYLATCLIHGAQEYERASELLEKILRQAPRPMHATAWLLLAQSRVLAGAHAQAEKALQQSRAMLPRSPHGVPNNAPYTATLLSWMIRQWELLLELRRTRGRCRSRWVLHELLGEVQEGFRALEGWEWARSCPLFAAEIREDARTLERLSWTTPYPAFRERIRKQLGELGSQYELELGPRSSVSIQIVTGTANDSRLKPQQNKHRLLMALASDFHQPHRIAELHEKIFPQDGFRPEVSADRVHKTIRRLRAWLDERDTGLNIVANQGGFVLQSHRGCRLLLSRDSDPQAPQNAGPAVEGWIQQARKTFGFEPFSAGQAWRLLGGSRRTLARRLSCACEAGLLVSSGRGPATTYRAGVVLSRAQA